MIFVGADETRGYPYPGLQSFLKFKVTLTLREVILLHDN